MRQPGDRTLFAPLFALLMLPAAAMAATDDAMSSSDEGKAPALMVLRNSPCAEDYAGELQRAGVGSVKVSQFANLNDVARFVGLPDGVTPSHILLAGGYVFADHVAPSVIAGILQSRPADSGYIGSSMCPAGTDHAWLDAEPVKPFARR